jgi:hypothetical protein
MHTPRDRYILAVLCLLLFSFGALVYSRMTQGIPRGEWGGDHISMNVGEGSAKLEFDCAYGYIQGPLVVDGQGKFQWRGTFTVERGGPARLGDKPREQPATYSGEIKGNSMTLSLKVADSDDAETFTLEKGKTARLVKCK